MKRRLVVNDWVIMMGRGRGERFIIWCFSARILFVLGRSIICLCIVSYRTFYLGTVRAAVEEKSCQARHGNGFDPAQIENAQNRLSIANHIKHLSQSSISHLSAPQRADIS